MLSPSARTLRLLLAAAVAAALVSSAPSPVPSAVTPAPPAGEPSGALAQQLVARVSAAGATRHLVALQRVADQHSGHRAASSSGDEASVDLIVGELRAAGFDVATPTFSYPRQVVLAQEVTVDGASVRADRLGASPETPEGGVSGPLVVVPDDGTPGCQRTDLAVLPAAGALLLVRRGGCTFAAKAQQAADAGAAALVVVNDRPGALRDATLGSPAALPVGGVSGADGASLATRAGRPALVDLRSRTETRTSANVIAQTRTGRTDDVVVLGGHLDSVEAGPGINDNASGSAGVLAVALALGSEPAVERAVRFAWWGAEEVGLLGSQAYLRSLDAEGRRSLGLYLNVDMIASPNPGYFVYDGDDSAREGAGRGPAGSAEIEQTLVDYLSSRGIVPEPADLDGRSDYAAFIAAGVAAGGLFSGADEVSTPAQAARWGGRAGAPFDPCYHRACDDLDNVDARAFDLHLDALAWTVGRYAATAPVETSVPPVAERTVGGALLPGHRRRTVRARRPPFSARTGPRGAPR